MQPAPTSLYRPFDEEPARATLRISDSGEVTFEFVSRGDFVQGRLDAPDDTDAPLVILVHDTEGAAEAASLDFAREWTRAGLAVARIDLPLHGRRQSPKLSERLVTGYRELARGAALDPDTHALVEEFARQSVSDVVRTAEALGASPGIDASRVGLVGLGIGACACAWSAPHMPSLAACVLAGGVGEFSDTALDPARRLSAGSNTTVYRLFHREDEVPASAVDELAKRLPGGPEAAHLEASPGAVSLSPTDAAAIGEFLRGELLS